MPEGDRENCDAHHSGRRGEVKSTQLHDLAACFRARFVINVRPLKKSEGAGNAGRSMHPQPGGQKGVDSHTSSSHHEITGNTQHSPRNGFNRLFRALPGEPGLFATVAGRISLPPT
jgi:hypothetical protein